MADDPLTIIIDETGRVVIENRTTQRRLAARAGRYRLVPSSSDVVLLERVEDGDASRGGHVIFAGAIDRVGGLVDVIQFIHGNRWSGQLSVINRSVRKSLYFKQGDVSTAGSNVPDDKIGAILYRYGMISAEQLEATLARVTGDTRIGQLLVESGILSPHDLYQFVRKQVEEIFYSVLAMREGDYYFYRTADEAGPPSQLQLATKQLLFDGVRRIDEMEYFREKITSSSMVPLPRVPPPPDRLPPREARVLSFVDGRRDVAAIARDTHLGEFETTKLLFQLVCSGHVLTAPDFDAAGAAAAPEDPVHYVLDTYNAAFSLVHEAVAAEDRLDQLLRGVESFFNSVTEFAPLFVGVAFDGEGRLGPDTLLANLEMAPVEDKVAYLQRGLNELLRFLLFVAGENVEVHDQAELHHRLHQIRRDLGKGEK